MRRCLAISHASTRSYCALLPASEALFARFPTQAIFIRNSSRLWRALESSNIKPPGERWREPIYGRRHSWRWAGHATLIAIARVDETAGINGSLRFMSGKLYGIAKWRTITSQGIALLFPGHYSPANQLAPAITGPSMTLAASSSIRTRHLPLQGRSCNFIGKKPSSDKRHPAYNDV